MEKLRQRSFFKITLEYVSGKINKSSKPLLFTTDAVYLIQGHFIVLTFVHFFVRFLPYIYTWSTNANKADRIDNDKYH